MGGTVAKGNRLQVLARKVLEAEGYVVHTAVRSVQRRGRMWISQDTDVFNAFDLIATRIEPPHPLRFIQVTTIRNVSKRIRKVDPVPVNLNAASVEVWGYFGGQKRLDRRYKKKKVWLPRNYFQIYYKGRNWDPAKVDRVFVNSQGERQPAPARERREAKAKLAAPEPMAATRSKGRRRG